MIILSLDLSTKTTQSSDTDDNGNIEMAKCPGTDTWCCGSTSSCCGTDKAISLASTLGSVVTSISTTGSPTSGTQITATATPTVSISTTVVTFTPAPQLSSTELPPSQNSGVSGGAVAGISIGVFIAGLLIGCAGAVFIARRRQNPDTEQPIVGGNAIIMKPHSEKAYDTRPPSMYGKMTRRPNAQELGIDRLPAEMGSDR